MSAVDPIDDPTKPEFQPLPAMSAAYARRMGEHFGSQWWLDYADELEKFERREDERR